MESTPQIHDRVLEQDRDEGHGGDLADRVVLDNGHFLLMRQPPRVGPHHKRPVHALRTHRCPLKENCRTQESGDTDTVPTNLHAHIFIHGRGQANKSEAFGLKQNPHYNNPHRGWGVGGGGGGWTYAKDSEENECGHLEHVPGMVVLHVEKDQPPRAERVQILRAGGRARDRAAL
jgi:hypothetical protein